MYVFYVTIIWGVLYWIVYPSFPIGRDFFKGLSEYSSRDQVDKEIVAARVRHSRELEAIAASDVDQVYADDHLRSFSIAGGGILFKDNCAPCHQSGGAGAVGYPTLADDEWLWGGSLGDIYQTLLYGIRYPGFEDTRDSEMPAFGDILEPQDIQTVAVYVRDMSMGKAEKGPGQKIYVENCAVCHSSDGEKPISDGNRDLGAPPLANRVWLNAAPGKDMSMEKLQAQISRPKHGVMPAWSQRLSDEEIKMLSVYVYSLGGGE